MFKKLLAFFAAMTVAVAFAAVDVNKATPAELDSIKGIGPVISAKIIDERKKGNFKSWEDFVERVKGIGEGNAAKFSAEGLTVGGAGYKGVSAAAASTKKDDKPAAPAAAAKADAKPATATAATTAPAKTDAKTEVKGDAKPAAPAVATAATAAATATPAMAKDEKKDPKADAKMKNEEAAKAKADAAKMKKDEAAKAKADAKPAAKDDKKVDAKADAAKPAASAAKK